MASAAKRTPEEIRRSVETTRAELTSGLNELQGKVREIADWRRHLVDNRQTALVGAAVAGFVIGGGLAATVGLFRRRR